MSDTINNSLYQNASLTPSSLGGTEIISVNVSLSKNQILNAALASVVYVSSDYSNLYITNYDLHIYDSNNMLIASSSSISSLNNVELIRFKASVAGTYRVVVYQYGTHHANNSRDWLSLTYNY